MVEVEIRNFQSLKHVRLMVDGFTAITGRSNLGKSAIIRAVKAALTGAPVEAFVRHGVACTRRTKASKTCKCFVSVHLQAKDFDLLWEKGDAVNRYTFNGAVYDKASKGTPDFLSPMFLPVRVGDRSQLLQVADQFSAIFLLDQTGGVVADVLSDVAQLDRVNVAIRMVERDRKEASSTRKVREKDVADLELQLERFQDLDEASQKARQTAVTLTVIENTIAKVDRIDGFLATGASLGHRIRELGVGVAVPVPEASLLAEKHGLLIAVQGWGEMLTSSMAQVERLRPIEQLVVPVAARLTELCGAYDQLCTWYGQLEKFREYFVGIKPVQALPVLASEELRQSRAHLQQVEGLLTRLAALEDSIKKLELAYETVLLEEKEVHGEAEALGVCPTCSSPLVPP